MVHSRGSVIAIAAMKGHVNHRNPEIVSAGSPVRETSAHSLVEPVPTPMQKLCRAIVKSHLFEGTMVILILMNFVMIVVEADSTAEKPDGNTPDTPKWIAVGGWLTLGVFLVELILRVFVDRWAFFHDGWNSFDFTIIALDTVVSLLGLMIGSAMPVSALRILRLCKLARVSRMFRIFPELRLMMAGLVGCMRSIFWGMVLLVFALLVWAIIGVLFIHPLNLRIADSGLYTKMGCQRCASAYSSVSGAALTLLQQSVAGDSWGLMTIPIIEEYNGAAFYFLGVMMTVSLAVLNLILGVVVNVAMEKRDLLAQQIAKEKVLSRVDAENNLKQVCFEMDTDESGQLSKSELMTGFKENELFRETLFDLGINEDDLEILWTILDPDKDGQVPYETFIHKSYSMKESDTQFMLAYIKYYVTRIKDQVLQGQQQLKEYVKGTKSEFARLENQQEDKMVYEKKLIDPTAIQLETFNRAPVTGGPRTAGSNFVEQRPGIPSPGSTLSSDADRRLLDHMSDIVRQLRDELNESITGVNSRLDTLVPEWTKLPHQPGVKLEAPERSGVWCCTRPTANESTSQLGVSAIPPEGVVQSPQYAISGVAVSQQRHVPGLVGTVLRGATN